MYWMLKKPTEDQTLCMCSMLSIAILLSMLSVDGVRGCTDPGTLLYGSRDPPWSLDPDPLPPDTVIHFSCEEGFILNGPPKIICTAEGLWLPSQQPSCIAEHPCSLSPCQNGATCVDSSTSPTGYHCHCPSGYLGQLCQQRMDCALPPDPEVPNSHYTVSGQESDIHGWYRPGAILTYTCDVGFDPVRGSTTRQCLEGQWVGEMPRCERPTTCTDPGTPENAHRCCQNVFTRGVRLSFYCEEGYAISGDDERTCRPDGTWSGVQPFCSKVTPAPVPDSNMFNTETLTIVMATTGSILGILVVTVILSSRQCRLRSHSRVARSCPSVLQARLARLQGDSDATPFLAVTDNINVVLPSYDEAVALTRNTPRPLPHEATPAGRGETAAEGDESRLSMQGRPLPPLPPPPPPRGDPASRPSSRHRRSGGRRRPASHCQPTSSPPPYDDDDVQPLDISASSQPGGENTEEPSETAQLMVGSDVYAEVCHEREESSGENPNCNNSCSHREGDCHPGSEGTQ